MTKAELVSVVRRRTGLGRREAQDVVNVVIEALREAMLRGERIEIRGLGVFTVKERAGRKGKDPRTQEPIEIPPRKTVVFKASKTLKEALNSKE